MGRRDKRRRRNKKERKSRVREVPHSDLLETRDPRTRWSTTRARGGLSVAFEGTGQKIAVDFERDDVPDQFDAGALSLLLGGEQGGDA